MQHEVPSSLVQRHADFFSAHPHKSQHSDFLSDCLQTLEVNFSEVLFGSTSFLEGESKFAIPETPTNTAAQS